MIIAKHTLHGRGCDAQLPGKCVQASLYGSGTLSSVFRCKNLVRSHFKQTKYIQLSWIVFWLKVNRHQPNAVTGLESAVKNNGDWLVRVKEWLGDYDCMPSCAALFTEAKLSIDDEDG